MMNFNDELFNLDQASEYFGLSQETIAAWCEQGKLRHVKLGRAVRIRKAWCIDFLEAEAAGGSHTPVADAIFGGG